MMTGEEFKQLFLPCSEQMFLLALRLTDSKADAEDAVQDVFVKLWRGRGSLGSVSNPQAYAMTMTRNRCLDIISARRDIAPLDAIAEAPEETVSSQAEIADAFSEAVDSLPETQRRVMQLRYGEELSMDDIRRQTGLSLGNLRVILCRARNNIRNRFNPK